MRCTHWALAGLLMVSWGCDTSGGGGGDDEPGDAAAATALSFDVETGAITVGETLTLTASATYEDGTTKAATVTWASSDTAIATVDDGTVTAIAAGEVTITATLETLTATFTLTVEVAPPALEGISVETTLSLDVGDTATLVTTGHYADGTGQVLEGVAWTSSDDTVVSVEGDVATAHREGRAILTASSGGFQAMVEAGVGCAYPPFALRLAFGDTFPALRWDSAFRNGVEGEFALADFYCNDEQYGDKSVLVLVAGAGWCAPCTVYAQRLAPQFPMLEAAGAEIIFFEVEDANYEPATSHFANEHLTRIIGPDKGTRVGDADTLPRPNFLRSSGVIDAFPTVFVVRRSDMRLIADSRMAQYYLPLLDIAEDPDADWSNPGAPMFRNNCEDGDDEAGEPNNSPENATPLAPGAARGGICDVNPDFYQIDIEGDWRFDIEFSHAQGDIDVFVWDAASNQQVTVNGAPVGAQSSDDNETFTHSGPALVNVYGYQGASATYNIILTEL